MIGNTKAARRYARALFDLAVEQGRLDTVQAELESIGQMAQADEALRDFLGNHLLGVARRIQILGALFEGKVDPLTLRFLLFLEEKRRLMLLLDIIAGLRKLADEKRGIVNVTIRAVQPLDAGELAALVQRLEQKFRKKIQARVEIDRSLLGGFQVCVGDQVYDYSIETQLQTLHRKLAHA